MKIKEYLKQRPFISDYLKRKGINRWIKNGHVIPTPHVIKQITILYYALANKLNIFVETGTYLGDMIWAQKNNFKKLYSIELSEQFFKRAKKRFSGDRHIEIIQGDSSKKIGKIVNELNSPAIFWLDGHYSGGLTAKGQIDCPIYAELSVIFANPFSHVILIDDARLFIGKDDYPTLEELKQFVLANSANSMKVENDIIILSK